MSRKNDKNTEDESNGGKTLIIKSTSPKTFKKKSKQRLRKSLEGQTVPHVINFENAKDLRKIITEKRLELIQEIKERTPESIRDLSRKVNRGLREVHEDLNILKEYKIVEFVEEGKSKRPVIPYENVEIEAYLVDQTEQVGDVSRTYSSPVRTEIIQPPSINPRDLMDPPVLDEYHQIMQELCDDLRLLNSNVKFLKHSVQLDKKVEEDWGCLLALFKENLMCHSVIVIWRIWDEHSDSISIHDVERLLFKNIESKDEKEVIKSTIAELKDTYDFTENIKPLLEMFRELRNQLIGHRDRAELEVNEKDTFHSEYGDVPLHCYDTITEFTKEYIDILSLSIDYPKTFDGLFDENAEESGGGQVGAFLKMLRDRSWES